MKKVLDRRIEDKEVGWTVDNNAHNSGISTADMYPIIQLIGQGTESYQRTGDKIKPKVLTVRGTVGLVNGQQTDNRPLYVRMIIATQKDIKRSTDTNVRGDASHLLRSASVGSPEQTFFGNLIELNYPVNDNKFRVYMDTVVKLCPVESGVEQRSVQTYRFVKRIKCPATLTFDEGNGDSPNNFAPFFALGYAYQDNSTPDVIATKVFSMVSSILTYEDA